MYNTYAVASQPTTTLRTTSYGTYPVTSTSQLNHSNTSIIADPVKTDFGKIKAIEVLHFRAAQLERSYMGESKFASMGPLQVLYFPQYDRFVLSINSWKYPLLKSIPVVGSSASSGVPVTYTLPTVNGFFTIVMARVEHMESLYNFELILQENTKFTVADSDELLSHQKSFFAGQNMSFGTPLRNDNQYNYVQVPSNFNLNGNMMRGTLSPNNNYSHMGQNFNNTFHTGMNQSAMYQTGMNQSVMTEGSGKKKKPSFWSRIFRKSEYGRDRGERAGSSRHNLNMIQKRDMAAMKSTNEVMAAAVYYPRKEVERWFIYNKEMSQLMGFGGSHEEGFDATTGSPIQVNYGSQNNSIHSDRILPCSQPITSDRPIENVTYSMGQNFNTSFRHDGKTKRQYITGHSHSVHPDIAGRFNNLSRSEFQTDRFKNMTNTSALYEASGISPINKIDQPYSFIQEDNNILEENRPNFTQPIHETVTASQQTQPIIQQTSHVLHSEPIPQQPLPVFNQTTEPHVTFSDLPQPQPTSILKSPRSQVVHLENTLPTHSLPTTENVVREVTSTTTTSTLPTLQGRIRDVPTTSTVTGVTEPSLLQRVRNVFNKNETHEGHELTASHHYAA